MEEFRGISAGEVSPCSLVNAWLCASDEEGKEEEEETVVERRRQSREQVRKSKVRGFGPRLERFGGVISLHIIVACVLCSRGIESISRSEGSEDQENWLLITVGNFKIGKWNEWASIGDDLSLLWW